MKKLEDMSLEELENLLKQKEEEERKIEKAINNNKELQKLDKEIDKIEKEIDKLWKKIEKKEKKIENLVIDVEYYPHLSYPHISQTYFGKETNIKENVFKAIKKAGFRLSKIKDTQKVRIAEYILGRLKSEDKELQELKQKLKEIERKRNSLEEKQDKLEEKITEEMEKKIRKIPYEYWEIDQVIERKKEYMKNPKLKEIEEERERFEESFDKIYEEFKKLIKGG